MNRKLVNSKTFESLNIIKYSDHIKQETEKPSLLERNGKKKKNVKIVSVAWHHNVLAEMFTITEKSTLLHEKVKFLTSPNRSRYHRLLLIFYR